MTWTVHAVTRTPEAIQYTPSVPLGRETWAHVRGDPPRQWYQWLPRCEIRHGVSVSDFDCLMTRDPDGVNDP